MSNPIKGMIAIISNYGVGKTTFALECGYHPKDIIFVNDDLKETGLEGDFNHYVDLVSETKGMKLLDFHTYCNDLIANLSQSKVIIWDTWTQYQNTFFQYVKVNEKEFRNPKEWAGKPSIKAGEWYNEAWRYEGSVIAELKSKCDLLILTFHLKQVYIGSEPVLGKFKPGHDRAIEKYADLRIWLTPDPNDQVPIGLVMKNILRHKITDEGIRTSQVLPLRLEICNWQNIISYWNEPVGNRELKDHERPNSFELSLIEGTLTPEDKRLYEASLSLVEKQMAQDDAEELFIRQSQETAIKAYIKENLADKPSPVIVNGIKSAIKNGDLVYNGEVTIAQVSKWNGE